MKRFIALILIMAALTGCGKSTEAEEAPRKAAAPAAEPETVPETVPAAEAPTDAVTEPSAEATEEKPSEAVQEETAAPAEPPTEAPTEPEAVPVISEPEEAPPAMVTVLDVPFYSQADMPTGCELVSTSMLLGYYDYDISAYDLIACGYIGTSDLWTERGKVLRGGDPNEVFIGDPFDKNGYGCYSGAVISGLGLYLEEEPYAVADLTGMSLPDICTEYIDWGTPVLVWATMGMVPSYVKSENTWLINDTGEMFTWVTNEHCLVLVGYDDDYYYFNDPLEGDAVPYGRELTEQRYRELGSQAVCIL